MAYIEYDPHDPDGRARAYGGYFLGLIVAWGSIGSVVYYIFSLISLFKGNFTKDFLYSLCLLFLMATIDFFAIFFKIYRETMRKIVKKYILFFLGGALDLSGIIGIIVSAISLSNGGTGIGLLLCSILSVLIITGSVVLIYRRIEGYAPIKFHADKDLLSKINMETTDIAHISSSPVCEEKTTKQAIVQKKTDEKNCFETTCIFCHKCGKKLPSDSIFCSLCGAKLK